MKDNIAKKISEADKISKNQIVDKIKLEFSERFDQIIIDSEIIRNDVFYIKYNAVYLNIIPKRVQFVMLPSVKNYFYNNCIGGSNQLGDISEVDKKFVDLLSDSNCKVDEKVYEGSFKPNKFRSNDQWQFLRKGLSTWKDPAIKSEEHSNKKSIFDNIRNAKDSLSSTVNSFQDKIQNLGDKLNDTFNKLDIFNSNLESDEYQSLKTKYFSQLKFNYEGTKISQSQPTYFFPELTYLENCSSCHGEKYVDCKQCNAKHEYSCPTCEGKGTLKCKGYVGIGNGGLGTNRHFECQNGRAMCDSCDGSGYKNGERCRRRCDRGWIVCPTCLGASIVNCELKYASSYGVGKLTDLASGKEFCKGKGSIICDKCYDDPERYGKVDCSPCKATGEIGTIVYVEIQVGKKDGEFYNYSNNVIQQIKDTPDLLYKYINKSEIKTQNVYSDVNGEVAEFYDFYSEDFCKTIEDLASLKKTNEYPRIISEEIYYDILPLSTLDYNHVLSGTNHKVSAVHQLNNFDVIFHSNPTSVNKFDVNNGHNIILWYFKKAFATKSYKEKIDKKNEILLLFRIAKSDGIIEESEKIVLSRIISNLNEFSNNEKVELFKLFSTKDFLPFDESETIFSTKERADLVIENLHKMTKQDGQIETPELKLISLFVENINKNIGKHPGFFKSFFKSWFLSIPLILFIIIIGLGIYLKIEKSKSESSNFNYRDNYDYNYDYNSNEQVNELDENQNVSQDSIINTIEDNDQFNSNFESDNIIDINSSYLMDDGKLIYKSSFYMIATGAFTSEDEAKENVNNLRGIGFNNSGYLWIPDYSSLSGKKYYSTFLGPFNTEEDCLNQFNQLPEEYTNGWYVKFVSE